MRTRLMRPLLSLLGALMVAAAQDTCPDETTARAECSSADDEPPSSCGCGSGTLSRGGAPAADRSVTPQTGPDAKDQWRANAEDLPISKLIWVDGGEFVMGHDNRTISPSTFKADGEGPARRVRLSGFWLGETEVSNAQWAAFAAATGHVSESEAFGWSFVFEGQLTAEANAAATQAVHAAPWCA